MKCSECQREVEVADGIALCHYHYTNENLEKEREKVLNDIEFQKWCSELRIGSRVELKDYRSN
jgi:hypothetical protein